MFQLEAEIQRWCHSLAQHDSMQTADVLELESHLRELISNFQAKELTEHEAFMIATGRLGATNDLVTEYEKVNTDYVWRTRILWMLGGYVAFILASRLISSLSQAIAGGVLLAGLGPLWAAFTAVIVLGLAWGFLLYRLHRQAKNSSVVTDRMSKQMYVWAVVGYLVTLAIARLATVPLLRFANYGEIGQLAMFNNIGALVIHGAFFIACVVLMWKLSLPNSEPVVETRLDS